MCTMQYFGHAYTKIIQLFIVFCVATLMGVGLGRRGRRTREKKKNKLLGKPKKSRILGSKSDLRFRGFQDQGTRKRI